MLQKNGGVGPCELRLEILNELGLLMSRRSFPRVFCLFFFSVFKYCSKCPEIVSLYSVFIASGRKCALSAVDQEEIIYRYIYIRISSGTTVFDIADTYIVCTYYLLAYCMLLATRRE